MASVSGEFDLDSFLELQSSDEDGSDLPELDRSLEDILNDSEDESSLEGSANASKGFLLRNPSFTHEEQHGGVEANTVQEERSSQRKKDTDEDSGSLSFVSKEKTDHETGNSHLPGSSRSNLKKVFVNGTHSTENKCPKPVVETKLLEQSRSSGAKLTELRLSSSMKKSAFWDFTGRSSPYAALTPAYTPASSLLARSPALSPLLGSARPSPKPGAALAAAAAASRPVPSPHAAAIKSRKSHAVSQKSFDSDGSSDSGKKIEAILEEEQEREGGKFDSYTEIDERGFQSGEILSSALFDSMPNKTDDETGKITDSLSEMQEGSLSKLLSDVSCIYEGRAVDENDEERTIGKIDQEKVLGENDEETSIGGNDETGIGGMQADESQKNDNDIPPSESEKSQALLLSNIDNCPEIQNVKSSEIHLENSCNASHVDTGDTISPNMFSAEATQIGYEKQDNTAERVTQHKVAKAVDEIVEDKAAKVENSRSGEGTGKKVRPSLKPLDLAEELEKRDASSGLHWEEGAAAQPMRLEGIRRERPTIGHLQIDSASSLSQALASQVFRRDHGLPQALAVHMNYIAVGMSKGTVLVTLNKYSTQIADSMDTKAFTLGIPVEKSQTPVTSLCFSQQGDLLLVGYGNGTLTLWEVQRATAAKVITGEHSVPIVHALFLGQDLQATRQFKAITGDCKGLVLLHTFAIVPLLRRFSVTTQCLLDGLRTGMVLSVSPLLADEPQPGALSASGQGGSLHASGGLGSMMGGVVGGVVGGETGRKLFSDAPSPEEAGGVVIFVTQQTALVVRLIPTLEVYAKLSRPDGIREGAMPYTAWRRITNQQGSSTNKSNGNSIGNGNADLETSALGPVQDGSISKVFHDAEDLDKTSLLAIAWDRKVQVAQLVKSELKVLREWSIDNAAQGVAWLDDQLLVVFTSREQLCLFTKEGVELHRITLPLDNIGGVDAVIYHTYFMNAFGNPEKAFHNSIAVRGAAIYLLGHTRLLRCRLLPWRERIQALQDAGDWMGALHMAMEMYDGNAQGVIGLPRTLDAMREAIMPFLLQLLSSYVDEAFSYISLAFNNQHGKLEVETDGQCQRDSVHVQITEQFVRVGGVAIEFCVHISRTDVLFESIFSKFVGVQHGGTFLELLEPYILKDMLGGLPPEIMQALVEHYSRKGWLQRIEQCVLHMDIASLDFNQVVRLCREHGLYSALIYLFSKGLDDFKAPLEELLAVAQDQQRPNAQPFGYKMLVYLKYCFLGLAFPPGHGYLCPNRLPSLKKELLQFLLDRTSTGYSKLTKSTEVSSQAYPNLCYLLRLDTEATLEVLTCAFVEDEASDARETGLLSLGSHTIHTEKWRSKPALHDSSSIETDNSEDMFHLVQALVNALTEVLEMAFFGTVRSPDGERFNKDYEKTWPSRKDIGNVLEFIARFVACGHATVSRGMLTHIMEYLASKSDQLTEQPSHNGKGEILRRREKLMFALLKRVPQSAWETDLALELAQQAHFHQVSGLIYMIKGQYVAALDSYIKDMGEPMYAFAFISNLLKKLADVNDSTLADFRSAVLARFPDLIQLSRELTFVLVLEHFNKENQQIMAGLRPHPKLLFLYLKTIMDVHSHGIFKYPLASCEDNSEIFLFGMRVLDHSKELQDYLDRISNLPELLQRYGIEVTDEMAELYLELLCQFEPKSVLMFLESFENYRLEHCLRLCQSYGVTDAAAFLLERVGDVSSALSLTILDVDMRICEMDSAVAKVFAKAPFNITIEDKDKQLNELFLMPEVEAVHAILCAAIGLCQRNTLRLDPQESESLWFRLLDTFSEAARNLCSSRKALTYEKQHERVAYKSQKEEQNAKFSLRWKVLEVAEAAIFLQKALAHFIGEIIGGMMGYVPLPVIMGKLLSDNGSQEFGDFKATILGMLGTYRYERTILDTAKHLIEDDTYYNINLLKKGASRAYGPISLLCSICGRALDKESFSSSVCIFHCGHSAHLQCETQDPTILTKDPLARCPICIPKSKSSTTESKMIATQNEIIRVAGKGQQTQAVSAQPLYETAMTERPYGLQQQSRFELLNSLQKGQKSLELGILPNLRLAPPLVYHDHKPHKSSRISIIKGESSTAPYGNDNLKNAHPIWQPKIRSSSPFQFPLRSSMFGVLPVVLAARSTEMQDQVQE